MLDIFQNWKSKLNKSSYNLLFAGTGKVSN